MNHRGNSSVFASGFPAAPPNVKGYCRGTICMFWLRFDGMEQSDQDTHDDLKKRIRDGGALEKHVLSCPLQFLHPPCDGEVRIHLYSLGEEKMTSFEWAGV